MRGFCMGAMEGGFRHGVRIMFGPVLALLLFAACSKPGPTPEELASRAAKTYYDHLVSGRYADYVAGLNVPDSIPDGYREQLVTNAKMFAAVQQKEHQGMSGVEVLRARTDSLSGNTLVYLLLCFGDSAREEIVVPMMERDGVWKMR